MQDAGLSLTPAQAATFHFNRGLNLFGAIDRVLHDCASLPTHGPVALRDRSGRQFPSDHYPMLAQIRVGACAQP